MDTVHIVYCSLLHCARLISGAICLGGAPINSYAPPSILHWNMAPDAITFSRHTPNLKLVPLPIHPGEYHGVSQHRRPEGCVDVVALMCHCMERAHLGRRCRWIDCECVNDHSESSRLVSDRYMFVLPARYVLLVNTWLIQARDHARQTSLQQFYDASRSYCFYSF